ncbi:hypothetical protein BJ085DRAFT_33418, partial [Dimargaris cristalligena]
MADEYAKNSQYQYAANSNLVLQADRSGLARRDKEATGEPETLWGRIDLKDMGSKAAREAAPVPKTKPAKTKSKSKSSQGTAAPSGSKANRTRADHHATVLSVARDMEGLTYRPQTQDTLRVLEMILAFVHPYLGDQPQDTIRSAADAALEILKDEHLRDPERKKQIEGILDAKLTLDSFTQLVQLGKRITDYDESTASAAADKDRSGASAGTGAPGEELGVSVVFDQDNEGEEEDEEDEDEEDEDMGANASEEENGEDAPVRVDNLDRDFEKGSHRQNREDGSSPDDMSDAEEPEHITVGLRGRRSGPRGSESNLSPRDIDAFWLQRQIASHYPDPHETQEKTTQCFELLSNENLSARECENQLMELFDYDHFDLVKTLTQHRELIYWCTQLAKTVGQSDANRS